MNEELKHLMTSGKLCHSITVDQGVMHIQFCAGGMWERVDPTAKLGNYRNDSWWEVMIDGRIVFWVQARRFYNLREKLGMIWPKNDGRWNWVRYESKYQGDWQPGQGVTDYPKAYHTDEPPPEEQAELQVLDGWTCWPGWDGTLYDDTAERNLKAGELL